MKGDDEDDEDNSAIGVARYPCMPSLVALQQMRNRLHLAHVGRKLMKWTAMATGRELRKIAGEILEQYEDFGQVTADSYMLLARARYFYPNLNQMVLTNAPQFPKEASVTVETTTKSITGCRVLVFGVLNNNIDNYEHLAIEKGGQAVADAKKFWLELVTRMVLILQLRTSFEMADLSHRGATKKQNVLSKIVIPRTEETIHYILLELEELAREELFRIKLVTKWKLKRAKKAVAKVLCPICKQPLIGVKKHEGEGEDIEPQKEEKFVAPKKDIARPAPEAPAVIEVKAKFIGPTGAPMEAVIQVQKAVKGQSPCDNLPDQDEMEKAMMKKERLEHLRDHINEVVRVVEEYQYDGLVDPSVENFLKSCEQVRDNIDNFTVVDYKKVNSQKIEDLQNQVNNLESLTSAISKQGIAPESLEKFLMSCNEFKAKLEKYKKGPEAPTEGLMHRLVSHLDETMELSREAREGGYVSSSVENFIRLCESMREKIENKQKETIVREELPPILKSLTSNVDDVMDLINNLKTEGLLTDSFEEFVKAAIDTKQEISNYSPDDSKMVHSSCSDSCTCGSTSNEDYVCDRCIDMMKQEDPKPPTEMCPPPCRACMELEEIEEESEEEEYPCDTCKGEQSPEESDDDTCKVCKQNLDLTNADDQSLDSGKSEKATDEGKQKNAVTIVEPTTSENEDLGYFEKKVKTIIRLKRTQEVDGSVKEEKETITITSEKHDPTVNDLGDDDGVETVSYETVVRSRGDKTPDEDSLCPKCSSTVEDSKKNNDKRCNICLVHSHKRPEFSSNLRKTKSETSSLVSEFDAPDVRRSKSVQICTPTESESGSVSPNVTNIEIIIRPSNVDNSNSQEGVL